MLEALPVNAPPMRPPSQRGDMFVTLPGSDPVTRLLTYEQAEALHLELGQQITRRMRVRGSATPPDGDIGGTPMLMSAAA
ncbi:hypothetical protein UFOVP1339_12 [uncultured Caudovirales phage]|uniref:Uncharacterized protein n=1 Tax=uncultured Caudovirales phage TaxID=2100421 RepID=A0A6J5RZG4_9CAUD|nr:hypothetical protein UFOVP1339_12 [uncultured Caudovirales phage]